MRAGRSGQILALMLLAGMLLMLNHLAPSGLPQEVTGRFRPIDGDSFHLGADEIRLIGIDAPEGRQDCERGGARWPCGREAASQLTRLVGGDQIHCQVEERDRYARLLAVCYSGNTQINRWMVEHGWALSYGRYGAEEALARNAKAGVWSGRFERPRSWRDSHQAGGAER